MSNQRRESSAMSNETHGKWVSARAKFSIWYRQIRWLEIGPCPRTISVLLLRADGMLNNNSGNVTTYRHALSLPFLPLYLYDLPPTRSSRRQTHASALTNGREWATPQRRSEAAAAGRVQTVTGPQKLSGMISG